MIRGLLNQQNPALTSSIAYPDSYAETYASGKAKSRRLRRRSERPVLLLEPAFVFRQEALKIMEEHPVEDCPLRMTSAIDSRWLTAFRRCHLSAPGAEGCFDDELPARRAGPRLVEDIGSGGVEA